LPRIHTVVDLPAPLRILCRLTSGNRAMVTPNLSSGGSPRRGLPPTGHGCPSRLIGLLT
jgi:hypothetical protein